MSLGSASPNRLPEDLPLRPLPPLLPLLFPPLLFLPAFVDCCGCCWLGTIEGGISYVDISKGLRLKPCFGESI